MYVETVYCQTSKFDTNIILEKNSSNAFGSLVICCYIMCFLRWNYIFKVIHHTGFHQNTAN